MHRITAIYSTSWAERTAKHCLAVGISLVSTGFTAIYSTLGHSVRLRDCWALMGKHKITAIYLTPGREAAEPLLGVSWLRAGIKAIYSKEDSSAVDVQLLQYVGKNNCHLHIVPDSKGGLEWKAWKSDELIIESTILC
jgi:hypothetical protein